MILYLVRHGETEMNLQHIMQGRLDSPLSPLGQAQAKAVAEALAPIEVDYIYHSTQGRAKTTAEYIAKHHPQAQVLGDDRLREIDSGDLEGRPFDEGEALYPEAYYLLNNNPAAYAAPGGETYDEVFARARAALEACYQKHPQATVVVVTHGFTLLTLMPWFFSGSWDSYEEPEPVIYGNCSITEVEIQPDKTFKLLRVNDCSHVPHQTYLSPQPGDIKRGGSKE